jgi:hypothetical protein
MGLQGKQQGQPITIDKGIIARAEVAKTDKSPQCRALATQDKGIKIKIAAEIAPAKSSDLAIFISFEFNASHPLEHNYG